MAKKKEENLVATKVEVKTPFVKKEEIPSKTVHKLPNGQEYILSGSLEPIFQKTEIFDQVIEDSLKQMEEDVDKEIFQNGNVGMGDSPSDKLDINGKLDPTKLVLDDYKVVKFVTDEKEILQFEKFGLLDSIQTIERSKIDLIKECIENGQNLEAIVLLQQLQTGEQWKIQEIIQSLS